MHCVKSACINTDTFYAVKEIDIDHIYKHVCSTAQLLVKTVDFNVLKHHFIPDDDKTGFYHIPGSETYTHVIHVFKGFQRMTFPKAILWIEKNLYFPQMKFLEFYCHYFLQVFLLYQRVYNFKITLVEEL